MSNGYTLLCIRFCFSAFRRALFLIKFNSAKRSILHHSSIRGATPEKYLADGFFKCRRVRDVASLYFYL